MAEIEEGVAAVEEAQAPKEKKQKVWKPSLVLKEKYDRTSMRHNVKREVVSRRGKDGTLIDTVSTKPLLEVGADSLKKMPCYYARKYALWHLFEFSEKDYEKLMNMTPSEIAGRERSGNWA